MGIGEWRLLAVKQTGTGTERVAGEFFLRISWVSKIGATEWALRMWPIIRWEWRECKTQPSALVSPPGIDRAPGICSMTISYESAQSWMAKWWRSMVGSTVVAHIGSRYVVFIERIRTVLSISSFQYNNTKVFIMLGSWTAARNLASVLDLAKVDWVLQQYEILLKVKEESIATCRTAMAKVVSMRSINKTNQLARQTTKFSLLASNEKDVDRVFLAITYMLIMVRHVR